MCESCDSTSAPTINERRRFLRLAGLGAGALLLGSTLPSRIIEAAEKTAAPPKPKNVISPDEALKRLMEGNQRYVSGNSQTHDFKDEREALVSGQNPFVAVLSCSDSRIAPEYAFDTARGDLFAVRLAGNFVTDEGLASLEYGVAVLGAPLILVLGHERCGAIEAGVKAVKDHRVFPGKIPKLTDALKSTVEQVSSQPGDLVENATVQNIKNSIERLKQATPLLTDALDKGQLKIVGGIYRLATGKVELVA
ncbi:twin-arginine translocation signal domain-containing protein [Pseudomonas sp. ODNR1LW]|jgi:carbonic anhydrase|uniref:carbonic anhydrase n=1 Tax=Pseudomonas putida TaxID=303 RepID=UPI0009809376|nr:carbonic anhydrase [Pseudomonas putida]NBB60504.1 twin-arginine translocation signal domain-containing protein [Pseudomonas sp. ODNR1LW]OMQ40911.1 carbonic anhydrase [Pseudomonas putida]